MMSHWRSVVLAMKVVFWIFYGPLWLTKHLSRVIGGLIGAGMLARRDAIECRGCGEAVSLLGRWECGFCGYVFDGFGFSRCEVCGAVPPFLECQHCGLTLRNPMIL